MHAIRRLVIALFLVTTAVPLAAATVSGVVFSTSGDPVVKAKVHAFRIETTAARRLRIAASAERPRLAAAVTGDDGSFSLDLQATGVIELVIEADGYAPRSDLALAGDRDLVLALSSAAMRTGRVIAGGKPVAGARVLAIRGPAILWTTSSDREGHYSMPAPGTWFQELVVLHPDFAPSAMSAEDQRNVLNVQLVNGREARGTVIAANGRPVKDARIIAGEWNETTSGEDGTFRLRHLPLGAISIRAEDGTMFGTAVAGEKDITIRLDAGRSITGVVRDADKKPLAGVGIATYSNDDFSAEIQAVTDDKGAYEILRRAPAMYNVGAFATSEMTFAPAQASLRNTRTARADFTAIASTYLRGTIFDERKRPVSGATVQWIPDQMPILYGSFDQNDMGGTQSGPDGRFRIPFQPGSKLRLQVLRSGYATTLTERVETTARPMQIVLRDGVEISGVVRDSDGKAIAGAGISMVQEPWGTTAMPIDTLLASGRMKAFVESGSDGTFRIRLNPTVHDLGVWKEGYAGYRSAGFTPGKDASLEIVLSRGVEIRGHVSRKSPPGALEGTIVAEGDDYSSTSSRVGPDGAFVLAGIREGTYSLTYANDRGDASAEKVCKAPASDVAIELPEVGELHVRVVDKLTREPLRDVAVSIANASGGMEIGTNDDNPDEYTAYPAPGRATITVDAKGYLSESTPVDVEAAKPKTITVSLSRGRTLTARVVDESGIPIEGANVAVEQGSRWQHGTTDDRGELELTGVSLGPVTVAAQKQGFQNHSVQVGGSTSDARAEIALSRGRKVKGRAVTSSGAPVSDAQVSAFGSESSQGTTTDANGDFVLEGLGDGTYSFRAFHRELGMTQLEDADISQEVVLTFRTTGSGSVHGRVRGFTDGSWMYGVVGYRMGSESAAIGRDGQYKLEHVPEGEIELYARAMSARAEISSEPVKVVVVNGQDVEADLEFRSDVVIRGVVTEDGRPAAGRRVAFSQPAALASATTDEHGQYTISAIAPGSYQVSVETNGESFDTRYDVRQSATFDIAIDYAVIQGRVVNETGASLQDVAITASPASRGDSTSNTTTDTAGGFTMRVFRGTYLVTATLKGYATTAQQASAGSSALLFQMHRADGLRVRLIDARDGHKLDGYVVATDAAGMNVARAHDAQADGSILLPIGAGTYRVSASSAQYATQSVRADVPREGDLEIPLTPGGTLVVNADRPSSDVVKLVLPGGEEYVRCECNGIAEIRLGGLTTKIEHVAPGTYDLRVLDEQGRIKTGYPVTVHEGQTTTVEIRVPE